MEAAIVLSVLVILFVIAPVITFLLVMRRLSQNNRVSPQIPTLAPLTWLVLPERPARLHRRLRRAVAMSRAAVAVHMQGSAMGTIPEVVADLERRACLIDSQLVVAARSTGPSRWSMLNELETQVYEIDHLATRVVGMTSSWAASTAIGQAQPASLGSINDRLDALESAMFEVGAIGRGRHPSHQAAPNVPPQPIPYLRRVESDRAD